MSFERTAVLLAAFAAAFIVVGAFENLLLGFIVWLVLVVYGFQRWPQRRRMSERAYQDAIEKMGEVYHRSDISGTNIQTEPSEVDGLFLKFSVMNKNESVLYHMLLGMVPKGYYVFPNMRLADVVSTRNGLGRRYYDLRNDILPRHLDFVICDRSYKPRYAIELNGSSHNAEGRAESDQIKKDICKSVGLPLEVIDVGEDYRKRLEEIIKKLV